VTLCPLGIPACEIPTFVRVLAPSEKGRPQSDKDMAGQLLLPFPSSLGGVQGVRRGLPLPNSRSPRNLS